MSLKEEAKAAYDKAVSEIDFDLYQNEIRLVRTLIGTLSIAVLEKLPLLPQLIIDASVLLSKKVLIRAKFHCNTEVDGLLNFIGSFPVEDPGGVVDSLKIGSRRQNSIIRYLVLRELEKPESLSILKEFCCQEGLDLHFLVQELDDKNSEILVTISW